MGDKFTVPLVRLEVTFFFNESIRGQGGKCEFYNGFLTVDAKMLLLHRKEEYWCDIQHSTGGSRLVEEGLFCWFTQHTV